MLLVDRPPGYDESLATVSREFGRGEKYYRRTRTFCTRCCLILTIRGNVNGNYSAL